MNQFFTALFGAHEGYVCVASKRGTEWKEQQFKWPSEGNKLQSLCKRLASTHDVFVCPALRIKPGGRNKGDGKSLWWLWADVDYEKIPPDKRANVSARIKQLGAIVVQSGTGNNCHVYVKLTREVTVTEHERLNTGLRDYLHADNKHADNSLLRVPETFNHKASTPTPTRVVTNVVKPINPTKLMALPTWKAVAGTGVDAGWNRVEVAVKPSVRSLLRMDGDEATDRYGSRHEAVWGVTRELVKRGYGHDEIHTLMDGFKPAAEKKDDEHGAYDVHKDVARCLKRGSGVDVDTMFSDVDEDEIDEAVESILRKRELIRRANQVEAERLFRSPGDDVSETGDALILNPPKDNAWLIENLVDQEDNVTLIAQYKVGKTTFVLSNLLRAIADGKPFLDEFAVKPIDGNVAFWNCEMSRRKCHAYVAPAGYLHPERLAIAHLRGVPLNIMTDAGKAWAVKWLTTHRVHVWAIDSLARLASMAGAAENDNGEMGALLARVDEIKADAGVAVCFIITHTGRAEMEDGAERARAATIIDDWPDARWVLTRDAEIRFLAVDGRDAELEQTALQFDKDTKQLRLGFGNKAEARSQIGVDKVWDLVKDNPGKFNKTGMKKALAAAFGNRRSSTLSHVIDEAIELGFVVEKPGRRVNEKVLWPGNGGVVPAEKKR